MAAAEQLTLPLHLGAGDVRVEGQVQATVFVADGAEGTWYDATGDAQPAVPYRVVGVLLPQGHRVATFAIDDGARRVHTSDVRLAPAQPDVSVDGIAGRSAAPVASNGRPGAGRLLGTGTWHGYTIASFAVYPVRHENGDVVVYENMALSVATEPDPGAAPVERLRHRDGFRERIHAELSRLVVNPEDALAYAAAETKVDAGRRGFQPTSWPSLEGSAVDYVIVTNDSLAATFQTLADFKTDKGVPTVVRTTEWIQANYRNGSDPQETLRNFVIDAYAKWGIRYVLLGGDTEQISPRLAWSGFYDGGRFLPADMYFGCLDGDWNANHNSLFGEGGPSADAPDLYAEVNVGRLPAVNNATAAVLIDKIQRYEMPIDPTYTHKNLLLAEVLFPVNWKSGDTVTLNGGDLSEFVYLTTMQSQSLDVTRMYETNTLYIGAVVETRQAAIDSLNSGFNFVNHIGHGFRFNMSVGDGSIQNADADALTNGDRLSNFYLLNCTAVAFTYFCLAEHFLLNPNGGAVTAIGANESAFPNASSHYMNTYYDVLFNDGEVHIGEAFSQSRLPRTVLANLGDNVDLWTHYIYSLLADPEMPLWTGPVAALDVSHTAAVELGTTPITVTVLDGIVPVDSAVVCLSKGNNDYQVGITNSSGQVTLNFRAEDAGSIKVVVTGHNYARHEGTITVNAGAPAYVSLAGMTVDDDNTGGTSGNGDGVIDAGETVDMWLSVANTGGATSGEVDVVLRSSDGGVTVVDSTANVGVVASSASVAAGDAVRVTFAAGLADASRVSFDLGVLEDSVETWADAFKKVVAAPVLSKVTLRIDDSVSGNGDGIVDPNELFSLYYGVKNFGTGAAPTATAVLQDIDAGFVFTDSTDTYGAIISLASAENTAGFMLQEPSTATEHRLEITITDLYGRTVLDTFELRPPAPPSNLALDPKLGPDRLQLTWDASPSADVAHYVVERALGSGGPWTGASIDPIAHTIFLDVGLASNNIYYYRVSAVDASGNLSVPSPAFAGSTNPAQLSGFPIALGIETASSPVVGDIDGDGDKEVVVGADFVYAFHHDGNELIDGDGEAQTWGVLTDLGGSYVSHLALGVVDNMPGLDIVAGSRDTKEVYVFDYTGTPVPGWPRATENFMRAGMVVGDIDGDGFDDIVTCDELGVVYAWRRDGSEVIDGDSNPGTQGVFYRLPGCSFQYSTPALADMDGDGRDEVVVGTQGDELYVIDDDASVMPGWPVALGSDVSGSVAVADLDDDGDLEVVVNSYLGTVRALHHDGSVLWSRWFANSKFFAPSPALADVDGNGTVEAFIPSSNGNIYGVTSANTFVPGYPRLYSSTTDTESTPIIADVDGDGAVDVLLGDESGLINGWDASGTLLAGFPLASNDAVRAVLAAADLDDDGDADVIAAGWDRNVWVWDFNGQWDDNLAPWSSFHADAHNSGRLGATIVTGIVGATFAFEVRAGAVDLLWGVPMESGVHFHVARAPLAEEGEGDFKRIAENVGVSPEGLLRFTDSGVRPGGRYVYRIESASNPDRVFIGASVYVPVTRASMDQNYPNPFNPDTRIVYFVPDGNPAPVSLAVFNVRGQRVRTLVSGRRAGGRHVARWDGRNDRGESVSSGVYFYRMTLPGFSETRKMLLVK